MLYRRRHRLFPAVGAKGYLRLQVVADHHSRSANIYRKVYYCDYIAPDGTPMTWVQPIDIVPDNVAAISDIVY